MKPHFCFFRLYLASGVAAQSPAATRVSEVICLYLEHEFRQAQDRPRDTTGKTLPIPESVVEAYSHIQRLVQHSDGEVKLATINNATVRTW